jgi:hypothetical protein
MMTLGPGPTLVYRPPHGKTIDDRIGKEVTDQAIAYLFEPVTLHPDLTLGDIFRVFDVCPALHEVFRREWSVDLCDEARKGPVPRSRGDNPADDAGIEYLELYWSWRLDTGSNTYYSMHDLDLHGVGPVLEFDDATYGYKAGSRINWAVSLTPVRELLTLPVRLRETVTVAEDDIDARAYSETIASGNCAEVLLGQVIQGLLWELSFHGGPGDAAEISHQIRVQVDEIKAGTLETTPVRDLFDTLDRPGFDALFETLGDVQPSAVSHAIHELGDDEVAGSALSLAFDGKVVVKQPFRNLPGREFRKLFRTVGE